MFLLISLFCFSLRNSWKKAHLREGEPLPDDTDVAEANLTDIFILYNNFFNDGISLNDINNNFELEITIADVTHYTNLFKTSSNLTDFGLDNFIETEFLEEYFIPIINNLTREAQLSQFTDVYNFFKKNETIKIFNQIITIADEVGPDAAKLLNVDYQKLAGVAKYLFRETNTVTYGGVFDKLGLNSDILKVAQTACKFLISEANIGDLISSLGASGLNELINAVSNFVPKTANESTNFISFEKIYNIVEPLMKLFNSIYDRTYYHPENFLKPIINSYILAPIDIITKSISDRASGLIGFLEKVNNYKDIKESKDSLKPATYSGVLDLLAYLVCDIETEDDENGCKPFETTIDRLKPLTNPKVNLTAVFESFGVPAFYVRFGSGLLTNLTDKTKTIVDLAYGFGEFNYNSAKYYKDEELLFNSSNFFDKDNKLSIIELTSKADLLLKFAKEININSNFIQLFKDIEISKWVEELNKEYLKQISNESLNIYNYSFFTVPDDVHEIISGMQNTFTDLLNSSETLINRYSEVLNYADIKNLFKLGSELTKTLPNALSSSTEIFYNQKLSAETGLKILGKFIELFRDTLDRKVPSIVKDIPFFGSFYKTVNDDITRFAGVLQNKDSKISDLLNSFYDGIGVLAEMIQSACSLIHPNTNTIPKVIEGVKPTSFINVFETMKAVSNLKKYSAIDFARCIKYDGAPNLRLLSTTISINDILPVKTVVEGSPQIYSGIKDESLSVSKVAAAVKIETTTITNMVKSVGDTVGASPVSAIKKVAVDSFGADPEKFDKAAEGIKNIGEATMEGKIADTNIDIAEKKPKLSTGAIVGIAVGCVVVVGLIIFLGVYFGVIRKKRSNTSSTSGK